jgi:hypothetical protein
MNVAARIRRAGLVLDAARRLGPLNTAVVAGYRLASRRGWLACRPEPDAGRLFHAEPGPAPATVSATEGLLSRAEETAIGRLRPFGGAPVDVGAPPDWRLNLLTGARDEAEDPWWTVSDADPRLGDIKGVWEASRFDWALLFARAAAATGEVRWIEALNAWTADWLASYPPYRGANWRCGQEASLRLLHILLAARLLDQDRSPAPGLVAFAVTHLRRIAISRWYAMAQDNNHATSEAAALFVGGEWLLSVGRYTAEAETWARAGRNWLENRARSLVFPDGGFAQYSVNYHRLMLDTLGQAEAWRRRLNRRAFSEGFRVRAAAAARWLAGMTSAATGDAPNLGSNDGARAFVLEDLPYRDHRGSVQLATGLFLGRSAYQPGAWDGAPLALGVELGAPDPALTIKPSRIYPDFGAVRLNPREDGSGTWAVIRVPVDRFRPGQADPLHLDLWSADGRNLLRDAGTWSYAEAEAFEQFAGIAGHNTVQFDGREPMPRLGRFLFGDWIRGDAEEPVVTGESVHWSGRYQDAFGAWHRRTIEARGEVWTVIDDLGGPWSEAVLRWRTAASNPGVSLRVEADGPLDSRWVQAEESLTYGARSPVACLETRVGAAVRRLVTTITVTRT